MLAHFIPHKGKGFLVLGLPLICGIILFVLFDAMSLNERYILPASLLISSVIIWFYDGGPDIIRYGFVYARKSNNTLCWIEIKYWAIVLGIAGCILLGSRL